MERYLDTVWRLYCTKEGEKVMDDEAMHHPKTMVTLNQQLNDDYEQLVQVAEMYVDAFGDDDMLTATEALRLTMVRDAIARWRNRESAEILDRSRFRCIACHHVHRTRFLAGTDGPCNRPIEDGVYCNCKAEVLHEG